MAPLDLLRVRPRPRPMEAPMTRTEPTMATFTLAGSGMILPCVFFDVSQCNYFNVVLGFCLLLLLLAAV
eukprot:scaffold86992_cov70-Cyclotella_meneghiniana.AAC.3